MAAASISLCFKGANFLSDKSGKDLANSILCQRYLADFNGSVKRMNQ